MQGAGSVYVHVRPGSCQLQPAGALGAPPSRRSPAVTLVDGVVHHEHLVQLLRQIDALYVVAQE